MAVTIGIVKQKPARANSGAQVPEMAQAPDLNTSQAEADSTLEALFAEHWSRVCTVLFRLVGDRDEAEDLALEAFWRLYRRLPKDLNLAGWLYRVATNLGLNALRSRKRRIRYEQEVGFLELTQSTSLDPAVETELAEQRSTVRRVLAEMNPRSAQLLVLRYSGLPYAEVASILDVAVSSIGTLLARAERDFEKRYQKIERR